MYCTTVCFVLCSHRCQTDLSCFVTQHRHPLIERLGLLYLLKLYNGKDFGTQAGAYWRMLFVLALMPWMRNYRVRPAQSEGFDGMEDGDEDFVEVHQQLQNEMMERSNRGGGEDLVGVQLELDLTRRAYAKLSRRNNDMKAALLAARDKVRELKAEKRDLKRQLNLSHSHTNSVPPEIDHDRVVDIVHV